MEDIYGDVGKSAPFAAAFGDSLDMLWQLGTKETLTRYLGDRL